MSHKIILSLVALLLAYAIVDDLRNYRIRNVLALALLLLYAVDLFLVGYAPGILGHLALSALLTFIALTLYVKGWMGAGDVKLFAAAYLWLDLPDLATFSYFLSALTIAYYAAAKFKLAPSRGIEKTVIPFAPCIAGAWLLTIIPTLVL